MNSQSTFFSSSLLTCPISQYPCKLFNSEVPETIQIPSSTKLCEICSKDDKMFLLSCITCNISVHSHCYLLETFQDPWQCQACLHHQIDSIEVSCKTCGQGKGALRLFPKGWNHVICKTWPSHRFLSEGKCGLCNDNRGKFVNCEVCWNAFHPYCGYLKGLRFLAGRVSCDEHFGFENIEEDYILDIKEMNKNEKKEELGDEPKKKRKIEDFFDFKEKGKEVERDLVEEGKEEENLEKNLEIEGNCKEGKRKSDKEFTFKENFKKKTEEDNKGESKGKGFKGLMQLRSRGKEILLKKDRNDEEKGKDIKNQSEKTKKIISTENFNKKNQKFCLNQNIAKSLKIKAKGTFEEIHQRIEDYLFLNGEVTNKGYSLNKNLQKIFGVKVILYKEIRDVLNKLCSLAS